MLSLQTLFVTNINVS